MSESLGLLPALPLLGFLILALSGGKLPKTVVAWVGAGSIGLAFLVALNLALPIIADDSLIVRETLYTWMAVGNFEAQFGLTLDGLSTVMILVITGVGFLIHLYSTGFMANDPSYSRFFAIMNLFVASMLILVLADNLLLLYLGWEGVGLCSYLLIGFWYVDPKNGYAARKAFVTTRVGDTSMALGLLLLFTQLGSLDIQELMQAAVANWSIGSGLAIAATLLLLGGAVGKSAQLPLQTWLPDAMAGPTPISALIHAATMVTAGVYLVARTHVLFELAPSVQLLVACIGLATLLLAGFTAMTQHDIKRILAYSTISQIGYMFLGLGVGAWSASVFHLMTHAFFKALLFLGAGSVINAMHHEQEMTEYGGLRKKIPFTYWSMMIGTLAITGVGIPLTTFGFAGFLSKDAIIESAYAGGSGYDFWMLVIAAAMTSFYSWRLMFLTFFGTARGDKHTHDHAHESPITMLIPLGVLSVGAVLSGMLWYGSFFGHADQVGKFYGIPVAEASAHGAPVADAGHGETVADTGHGEPAAEGEHHYVFAGKPGEGGIYLSLIHI